MHASKVVVLRNYGTTELRNYGAEARGRGRRQREETEAGGRGRRQKAEAGGRGRRQKAGGRGRTHRGKRLRSKRHRGKRQRGKRLKAEGKPRRLGCVECELYPRSNACDIRNDRFREGAFGRSTTVTASHRVIQWQ